jgi:hypothetical protein
MAGNCCAECGSTFAGRLDKKFCCDQCRASHHNKSKRQNEKVLHEVNQILRKNRSILKGINPVGKSTVRVENLKHAGFDFSFFTNVYKTSAGNVYFFCYEYEYQVLPEGKILIVNRQDYMNNWSSVKGLV